jgi:5-methyltetrahydrofolate--homocysteine methyltransferase
VFTDGTPQQVRDEVRRRVDDFAPGGGFVAAAVHNIQANVPAENIIAMWEAIREYGSYDADNAPGRRPESYWIDYPQPIEIPAAASQSPDARIAGRAMTPEEAALLISKSKDLPAVLVKMRDGIIDGSPPQAIEAALEALASGIQATTIISDVVIPAMEIVGEKFECGEYFLPEMMASALGTQGVMKVLRPKLTESGVQPLAKAVIGTVKGDLHDIGKNIVAVMFEGAGYEVVDLGIDVSKDKFADALRQNPDTVILGVSALLTTTMTYMKEIIDEVRMISSDVKIVIGGAPVTQAFADEIKADAYAAEAATAVDMAARLLN